MARNDGRIEKGQRLSTAISAKAWNRAQQAADIVLGAQPGAEAGSTSFGSSPYIWVYAKNTTGSDVARWGVMAITGVQITPSGSNVAEFERMPVLTGAAISGNEGKERCVAVEPIANNAVGRVAVSGAVQIKTADIAKVPGAVVLWKDATWAFVRLGGSNTQVGKAVGASFEGGEFTTRWPVGTCRDVTVWKRTGTNCVPTASSPTETVEAVANLSHDVAANSWVVISQGTDGKWYLVGSGIEGSCRQTIGGEDVTRLPGWSATKVQLLGHDASGCLKWFDGEECPTGTT